MTSNDEQTGSGPVPPPITPENVRAARLSPDGRHVWDGTAWRPARPPIDNVWAWLSAAGPITVLLLVAALATEVAKPTDTLVTWASLAMIGVNTVLATMDTRALQRSGVSGNWGVLGALLMPVYLVIRTVRAKTTPAIPAAWVAALLVSIIAWSHVVEARTEIDESALEQGIERQLADQLGGELGDVVVECPEIGAVADGDRVECTADDGTNQVSVYVMFSGDGAYTWSL